MVLIPIAIVCFNFAEFLFEDAFVEDQEFVRPLTTAFVAGLNKPAGGQNGTVVALAVHYQLANNQTPQRPLRKTIAPELARAFAEIAGVHLHKAIPEDAVSFEFVGAGSLGLAFNVTDADDNEFILKLEVDGFNDWRDDYASVKKMDKALVSQRTGRPSGGSHPMVYDKGSFEVFQSQRTPALKINWFLLQKFELEAGKTMLKKMQARLGPLFAALGTVYKITQSSQRKTTSQHLVFNRLQTLTGVSTEDFDNNTAFKALATFVKKKAGAGAINNIQDNLRLASDWLEVLVRDVMHMAQEGIQNDFHAGNIGIQRNGPEGYLKFFD